MNVKNLRRTLAGLVILSFALLAPPAHALVPQAGSVGIRTVDPSGYWVHFQTVRVHQLEGNWPQPDVVFDTNTAGQRWFAVLPGVYEVVALGHDDEPLPGGFVVGVASGSEAFYVLIVPPLCPGDVNNDGDTDFGDVLELLANWGPCGGACPWDLSGNGHIDFADVLVVIGAWGSCS
ncbi:MAG: hypothetical protein GY715_00330 [Planctomycetes bacterium]|nr:hypothetical protein [Planctomycetota bacterium]